MKNIFIILFTTLISFSSFSQNQLDTVMVGKKVFYMPQHAFKIDALRFISGEMIFAYENVFGYNNGIEFEIGPTISMIGTNRMNFMGLSANIPHYSYEDNFAYDGKMGFLFSVGYRKYVLKDRPGLNGLFVGPKIKLRNYNNSRDFSSYSPAFNKQYKNQLYQGMVLFNIGMDHFFKSKFGIEYYFYSGLTFNSFRYHYFIEDYNYETDTWNNSVERTSKTFSNFNIGIGLKLFLGT